MLKPVWSIGTVAQRVAVSVSVICLVFVTAASVAAVGDSPRVQQQHVFSRDGASVVSVIPMAGPGAEVLVGQPTEAHGGSPELSAPTWTQMTCPSGLYLHAVSMGSPLVGFAAGELGVVLRTIDGGNTWQYALNQGFPYYYYGVQAFNANTVFITGFNNSTGAGVFRWSDDGGNTWGPVVSLTAPTALSWLFVTKFSDANHGMIQGFGGGVWYTTTGGRTTADWHFTQPTVNWWQGTFTLLPDGRAWMTGYDDWRSTNFGAAWTQIPNADPVFDGPNHFLPDGHGFIGGGSISPAVAGWLYASTNGGDSWTSSPVLSAAYPVRAILRSTDLRGWAVGGNVYTNVGGVWGTTDGGTTWTPEQEVGAELQDIAWVRVNATQMDVYAVGMISQIWRARVAAPPLLGDLNCDGVVNFGDINPFVLALVGQDAYEAAFPNCVWLNADINGDGTVNFGDINPFVALLAAQ